VVERVAVKICGLTRREDALAAERAGADYLGVIVSAGFGRSVDPTSAHAIVQGLRPSKVAVVVDGSADEIQAAAEALGADVLQIHGAEEPNLLVELRARGSWKLWKSVRARSLEDVEEAVERYGSVADGILVEGHKEGVLGGGGARVLLDGGRVRELIPHGVKFVLAGGLGPATVAEAVRSFRPDVVDVSSGVERALREKDHMLIEEFIRSAGGAPDRAGASPTGLR
jgi:phosphoribosylanthranilate isomerase